MGSELDTNDPVTGLTIDYEWTAASRVDRVVYGAVARRDYFYDDQGRLILDEWRDASGIGVAGYVYGYRPGPDIRRRRALRTVCRWQGVLEPTMRSGPSEASSKDQPTRSSQLLSGSLGSLSTPPAMYSTQRRPRFQKGSSTTFLAIRANREWLRTRWGSTQEPWTMP